MAQRDSLILRKINLEKKISQVLTNTKILVILKNVASNANNDERKKNAPPSSSGLGHLPFTEATGIRIPLGVFKI